MGKSTASCFKIISCAGDSVDHDDLQTSQSKSNSDRRGWSFRKRSARHRILSNSVISESTASASKENPESTAVNFQVQPELPVPEKSSVIQCTEEKTELSAFLDSKLSDIQDSKEDEFRADATIDESSAIIIQAAVRGLLAQQVLLKQKNIIKLQAVVRGHVVRRHAVGTLRCVQAIIKMQALVRARHASLLLEGSADFVKKRESSGQGRKEVQSSGTYTYVSIEKLLSNAFARQLMEATPRTQPINIKCDPLKSDSAWKWFERWMSVSSVSSKEQQESGAVLEQHDKNLEHSDNKDEILSEATVEQHDKNLGHFDDNDAILFKETVEEQDKNLGHFDCNDILSEEIVEHHDKTIEHSDCKAENPLVQVVSNSTGSETGSVAFAEESNEDILSSNDTHDLNLHAIKSTSPSSDVLELHNNDLSNSKSDATETAPPPADMKEPELAQEVEVKYLPEEKQAENDQDLPDFKMLTTEQSETEAKKLSRKASNPAFIAAQSKFEEMSSAKLTTSSSHDPVAESRLDKGFSSADQPLRSKDNGLADNAISNASAAQRGSSECGTELSVSSTLDSPDRSEAGVNNSEMEVKASDKTDHLRSRENLELEATSIVLETDPSCTNTNKLERYESFNSVTGESLNSSIPSDLEHLEKKPETDPSHLQQLELGSELSQPINKSSPEASPRNHITIPESQETPSSQLSVKSKKRKGDKSESNRKNRSSSADKNISNHNQDSASRSSLEQLQEHKTGKRRNSFGSARSEHREQEPRDSSSSNSLPSYMQATESAKAKAIANGSPRSSPDVNDKDIYIKKRHSLPGINERQGSPRINRSLSQAQQNAKGNASHSPQDRKWRR